MLNEISLHALNSVTRVFLASSLGFALVRVCVNVGFRLFTFPMHDVNEPFTGLRSISIAFRA